MAVYTSSPFLSTAKLYKLLDGLEDWLDGGCSGVILAGDHRSCVGMPIRKWYEVILYSLHLCFSVDVYVA